MNVYLIVHPVPKNINKIIKKPAYVIAVDQGLFDAYKQGVKVDIAIGDFDSLKDKRLLERVKYIQLNEQKDVTDTESALLHAKQLNPNHIYILGGLGGKRFEHSYANLLLVYAYSNVTILTDESRLSRYDVGKYDIKHDGYINVFSIEDATISLKGFKYPLYKYQLKRNDRLGISNELINDVGELEVLEGQVVVICTRK